MGTYSFFGENLGIMVKLPGENRFKRLAPGGMVTTLKSHAAIFKTREAAEKVVSLLNIHAPDVEHKIVSN